MAFVVAGGGVLVWRISHGNYSDYSCHSNHSNHRQYGDSALRSQIGSKEREVSNKESGVENLRQRMNNDFNSRISQLKREKNYSGLTYSPDRVVADVKADMRRELDAEIQTERDELKAIDEMIARINQIELQSRR